MVGAAAVAGFALVAADGAGEVGAGDVGAAAGGEATMPLMFAALLISSSGFFLALVPGVGMARGAAAGFGGALLADFPGVGVPAFPAVGVATPDESNCARSCRFCR